MVCYLQCLQAVSEADRAYSCVSGMNTSTIPVYVSETARSHRRGRMVAVQLSIVIFGIVFAYWLDYGSVRNLTGEVNLIFQAFHSSRRQR